MKIKKLWIGVLITALLIGARFIFEYLNPWLGIATYLFAAILVASTIKSIINEQIENEQDNE